MLFHYVAPQEAEAGPLMGLELGGDGRGKLFVGGCGWGRLGLGERRE